MPRKSAHHPPVPPSHAAHAVAEWFRHAARDLPWRTSPRDPYRSLVSEFMLQQTQVARVVPYFERFLRRFPTIRSLALADQADVLSLWSGLGYYRRARFLHDAARAVLERHGGIIPRDPDQLARLPGLGRYTAGAVASIVFGLRAPIVDGNVARVLLRLHGVRTPRDDGLRLAWGLADDLVNAAAEHDVPALNEGLMELGATVCTPRSPSCGSCPLAGLCLARSLGITGLIPEPKLPPARATITAVCVVIRDRRGRLLLEQRPDRGLWAGLWQVPTLESAPAAKARPPSAPKALRGLGLEGLTVSRRSAFSHATSHRDVRFVVLHADAPPDRPSRLTITPDGHPATARAWLTPARARALALSNPQRSIIEDAAGLTSSTSSLSRARRRAGPSSSR
ncbi:MAG: A/G-specific adenine glycosylase [Phycisphaeraceae bacterium]|nr:MAG: A/G-specific adenine glycosylase [Phycisphaeraceae bacterium]